MVIDVTDFFKGDNQPVSLSPGIKRRYSLGGLSSDRSYISYIHSFPLNTEVRTVKTYSSSPSPGGISFGPSTGVSLPAAEAAGAVTIELNNSFIMLPDTPMRKRLFDPRVGYFASDYTVYGDDQQKVKTETFIHVKDQGAKNDPRPLGFVTSIEEDSRGQIWIFEPNGRKRQTFTVGFDNRGVEVDAGHNAGWICTRQDLVKVDLDGTVQARVPMRAMSVAIEPDTGYAWCSIWQGGVYRLDTSAQLVRELNTSKTEKWLLAVPK